MRHYLFDTDILSELIKQPASDLAERIFLLEREGRPIGSNDMLITAHTRALGLTLITANIGEFSRVPGLMVENWL